MLSKSCLYILEYVEFAFDLNLSLNNRQETISLLSSLNKNKHILVTQALFSKHYFFLFFFPEKTQTVQIVKLLAKKPEIHKRR